MNVKEQFPILREQEDFEHLKRHLDEWNLRIIENVVRGYVTGQVKMEVPRFDDGVPDTNGEFVVCCVDPNYRSVGGEVMILKWFEGYEDAGYLIDCIEEAIEECNI